MSPRDRQAGWLWLAVRASADSSTLFQRTRTKEPGRHHPEQRRHHPPGRTARTCWSQMTPSRRSTRSTRLHWSRHGQTSTSTGEPSAGMRASSRPARRFSSRLWPSFFGQHSTKPSSAWARTVDLTDPAPARRRLVAGCRILERHTGRQIRAISLSNFVSPRRANPRRVRGHPPSTGVRCHPPPADAGTEALPVRAQHRAAGVVPLGRMQRRFDHGWALVRASPRNFGKSPARCCCAGASTGTHQSRFEDTVAHRSDRPVRFQRRTRT